MIAQRKVISTKLLPVLYVGAGVERACAVLSNNILGLLMRKIGEQRRLTLREQANCEDAVKESNKYRSGPR